MSVFYHEDPSDHSKKCKLFLAATLTLKEAFSNCRTFGGRLSTTSIEEDYPPSDFDQEQDVFVSIIRSRVTEKLRRKPCLLGDSSHWVYPPATRDSYASLKEPQPIEDMDDTDDEREEYLTVGSCFSCCSSGLSREAFYSAKTDISRCSSFNGLRFPDLGRRSIIQEFCHCKGWPFGLCRKALLLPPLPKSPSESWLHAVRNSKALERCSE